MFFAFGNTFVFLVVQISGYVLIFSNFLHRAIHLLYIGGSKFHDIYFVCIGQYICGIGGSKFHDIFFYFFYLIFCIGQYICCIGGSKLPDIIYLFIFILYYYYFFFIFVFF